MVDLAAERGYDLSRCYAYSDSASDLPMLEAVGHPVVVNPEPEVAPCRNPAPVADRGNVSRAARILELPCVG